MSIDAKQLKNSVLEALRESRLKRIRENIHYIEEDDDETTQRMRAPIGPDDKTIVKQRDVGRRPVDSRDIRKPVQPDEEKLKQRYVQKKKLTPEGVGAAKMNTIWTNNLTQIMNFNKGEQLAMKIAANLQKQTGLPGRQMLPIVSAVMKATLEQLDDEVLAQIQSEMPGVLDKISS